MATLSHVALRELIARFSSPSLYFSEMINAATLVCGGPFEKFYLKTTSTKEKIVWQIVGDSVHYMTQAAKILCDRGGAGLDINMGCSSFQIVKTGAGIAWRKKPICEVATLIKSIKNVVKNNSDFRLSVKTRLGYEDYTLEELFAFCDMLYNEGVQMITLHPRTRRQKYSRPPHYDIVQKLCEHFAKKDIEIVLNGDISSIDSLNKALAICPDCSAVMIARAAVKKPWIFGELMGIDCKGIDIRQTGIDFINLVESNLPQEFLKTRLQRFFTYYCDNLSFAHYQKCRMLSCNKSNEFLTIWQEYFEKCPEDILLL